MTKRFLNSSAVLVALVGGLEVFARHGLGLGTPPLSVSHPEIEYMFAPDQEVYRFGNLQAYNAQGMRSPPMETVFQPRRILVFGDSVLNGGNLTDQSELGTTLATSDDLFFGNVSAGSWGPANMHAWFREFGSMGADTAIIVVSSHDLSDLPSFEPLDPTTHPMQPPLSALTEAFTRYIPRYIPSLSSAPSAEWPAP